MRQDPAAQITASTPVGEAAVVLLGERLRPVFELERAAASGDDMEAVHDMRVASRRTREALALFAPLYRTRARRAIGATARDITRSLGPLRDADIFCDRFSALAASTTDPAEKIALSYLLGYRQARREDDLERVRERLAAIKLRSRRQGILRALRGFRRSADLEAPLALLAREALSERLDAFWGHLPAALAPEAAPEQHAMRIAGKHLRYAIETLSSCLDPSVADELLRRAKEFQDVLGEIHDRDVFSAMLAEVGDSSSARGAGVTAAGLGAVAEDLAAERGALFARFTELIAETPSQEFSAQLLGALVSAKQA